MPSWLTYTRSSPDWKFDEIRTCADARFALSASVTVSEPSIVVAGSPSVYATDPAEVVTTGASLAFARLMMRVATLLAAPSASVAWKLSVFDPDGFWLTFSKVTERSALW